MKDLILFVALAFGLAFATPAMAASGGDAGKALGVSRQALGSELPDLVFTASDGRAVRLSDYRGRPLLLSLIYTGCTDVCPLLTQHLRVAVEVAQETFGGEAFAVLTVGFDAANDSPGRLLAFARRQGADLPNWEFVSGDQESIDRLAEAVGFSLYPSAGGFGHMAQVSVIDADGRIYQQVYGDSFETPAILEPLKDLHYGRQRPVENLSDLVQRVKLFCTVYDPNTGRYYFDYSFFIGAAIGLACLSLVLSWLVGEYRRSRPLS
jgi:protein SCO1/2